MVLEVAFFVLSVFALGVYLLSRDLTVHARHWLLRRRMETLLGSLPGQEVARAETLFGYPTEIVQGAGRRLYVWKGPHCRRIPRVGALVIVTLTTDAAGLVTSTSWEQR